jgi:large subunit ribosomal protein L19
MLSRLSKRVVSLAFAQSKGAAETIVGGSRISPIQRSARTACAQTVGTRPVSPTQWNAVTRGWPVSSSSKQGFHTSSSSQMASRDAKSMKLHKPGDKLVPAPRGIEPPIPAWEAGLANDANFGKGGGGMSPFTPTKDLRKRKTLQKRASFLMQTLEHEKMTQISADSCVTPFRPGDVIRVKVAVLENRGRANNFTGICIARRNRGMGSSFTLRSVVANVPVERTFPLYAPTIKEFEILERRKVRRGKLYYLRDKPLRYSRV